MKSINKIAIVIAAAVTSTLLVSPSANAVATIGVSINGAAVTTATSAATPATVSVPADNSVDAVDAVKFALSSVDAGSVVTAVANNAFIVPALSTLVAPVTASAGVSSLSVNTGTGTTAEFYVYTKSATLGTVTITNNGNSTVFYVKGTAGPAYNLAFAPVAQANTSSSVTTVATVTDVFGNPVIGVLPVATAINATVAAIGATAADGTTSVAITYPATAGKAAISLAITAVDVKGFAAANKTVIAFVDVADLAALLAAEKAARAADKAAADKALADAQAKAAADIAAAQAAAATAKKEADDALAAATKAAADAKAVSDKAIADLTAQVAALTKAVATIKAAYNKMAKKFKQPLLK